jgi:RNA polymerase sigma-70 factor (ECF subfamily)
MSQMAQAKEYRVRDAIVRNTVHTRPARQRDNRRGALPALCVSAEQDDAQLVAAARSGVNDAFDVLVRRYRTRILSVAGRFTRNREDAEDVAQQAFHKAFLHIRQFQGNSSFSTWLTRIAMNESLMWLRKKRVSSEVSLEVLNANTDTDTSMQVEPADCAPNPEETCLQLETQRIVSAAVRSLRSKLREVMQLRELGEMSTEKTAEVLGLSVGAVKARLFHGRRKLRPILEGHVGSTRIWRRVAEREVSPRIDSHLLASKD